MVRSFLLACLTGLLLANVVMAISITSVPRVVTYQGRVTDAGGTALPDGPKSMRFIIWADSTSTNPMYIMWDSGPLTVTTEKGLFTVKLGQPPQPTLDYVTMFDSLKFLGITVGADPEMTPRTRLTAAPFAYTAQNAVSAGTAGMAYSVSTNAIASGQIVDGTIDVVDLSLSAVPAAGVVEVGSLGTTTATNVASPTSVDSVVINVPAAGNVLVTLEGRFLVDGDATSTSSIRRLPYFGLCTSRNSSGSCGTTWDQYFYVDPDNATNFNEPVPFSMSRLFTGVAAGPFVVYINAQTDVAPEWTYLWGNSFIIAQFYPAAMTVTTAAKSDNPNNPAVSQERQR